MEWKNHLECRLDQGTCFWWAEYSKNDGRLLSKLCLQKNVVSILFALSAFHTSLRDARCYILSYSMERSTWQITEEGYQLIASKTLGPSLQQPMRNWISPITMRKRLKVDPPSVGPSDETTALTPWLQPCEKLWGRGTQKSYTQITDPQNVRDSKCLLC